MVSNEQPMRNFEGRPTRCFEGFKKHSASIHAEMAIKSSGKVLEEILGTISKGIFGPFSAQLFRALLHQLLRGFVLSNLFLEFLQMNPRRVLLKSSKDP